MNVATRAALRISLVYVVLAIIWIVGSDILLNAYLANHLLAEMQTAKGIFFIVVTGGLLFALIRRSFEREMSTRESRKESEHRWRELVDHSREAILLLDGNRIVYGNMAAAKLIGVGDTKEIRGKNVDEIFFNRNSVDEARMLVEGEEEGHRSAHRYSIRRVDGASRMVEDHSTSVRLAGRQVTLSILMDVTERVEYERMLIQAKEEAESLLIMKESILTNISHELRTPLTGILGIAEALINEVKGEAHDLASLLHESGWRLARTLDSILTLAKLESDTAIFAQELIDVVETSSKIVRTFKPHARAKDISLELIAPRRRILVLSDPVALDQIIMNLISNSIKFTKSGGVTVKIHADDSQVYLDIEDTGVGISESFLPHIFEEYRQESQGVSREFEGSGLGMSIVKRLLDRLGGDIRIESEKGVGTTVHAALPLASKTWTRGTQLASRFGAGRRG
jgi:PAS domain S-box-containing protein